MLTHDIFHTNYLKVLKGEIETAMRLLGVEKISDLGMKHVSDFEKKTILMKFRVLIIIRSTHEQSSGTFMTATPAWRNLVFGSKPICRNLATYVCKDGIIEITSRLNPQTYV